MSGDEEVECTCDKPYGMHRWLDCAVSKHRTKKQLERVFTPEIRKEIREEYAKWKAEKDEEIKNE